MKFRLELPVACDPDLAAATLADPDFLTTPHGDVPIGDPQLVSHVHTGDRIVNEIRWTFIGDLNAAARAILDPSRLRWVQRSTHDLATRRVVFEILPDHYADRLQCQGRYLITDGDPASSAVLRVEGEVRVRALVVAGQVERILVDGLTDVLRSQMDALGDQRR